MFAREPQSFLSPFVFCTPPFFLSLSTVSLLPLFPVRVASLQDLPQVQLEKFGFAQ
jgi:hypothetical protein